MKIAAIKPSIYQSDLDLNLTGNHSEIRVDLRAAQSPGVWKSENDHWELLVSPTDKADKPMADEAKTSQSWGAWLEIFAMAVGMLSCEVIFSRSANYVYSDLVHFITAPAMFGGIAIGNLAALLLPHPNRGHERSWEITSCIVGPIIAHIGVTLAPNWTPLWMFFPFIGFGHYLARRYIDTPLVTLVVSSGMAGVFTYLFIEQAYAVLGTHSWAIAPLAATLAGFASSLPTRQGFDNALRLRWLGLFAAGLAVVLACRFDLFVPQSFLERTSPNFARFEKLPLSRFSPLFRTDLYRNPQGQVVFTVNGSRFGVIPTAEEAKSRIEGRAEKILTYDLPYEFLRPKRTLVIGSAEGSNIIAALRAGVEQVVAVDINPAVIELMTHELAQASGGTYLDPRVRPVIAEGRSFIQSHNELYDLITLQGVQTGSSNSPLNQALLESMLFTREAIQALWNRLTDQGAIYFDEYRDARIPTAQKSSQLSLVEILERMARETLFAATENPDLHVLRWQYLQARSNPNSRQHRRFTREGLLISKSPLGTHWPAAQSSTSSPPADLSRAAWASHLQSYESLRLMEPPQRSSYRPITDDNPFYFQIPKSMISRPALWLSAFLIAMILVAWQIAIHRAKASKLESQIQFADEGFAITTMGIAYILFVMGSVGPISSILGIPSLSSTIVFVTTLFVALFTSFFMLKAQKVWLRTPILLLGLALMVFAQFAFGNFQSAIGLPELSSRVAVSLALLVPFAMLCEMSYISLLQKHSDRQRGWLFTLENLGTLFGIPIGTYLQLEFGYSMLLTASGLAFVMVALLIRPIWRRRTHAAKNF